MNYDIEPVIISEDGQDIAGQLKTLEKVILSKAAEQFGENEQFTQLVTNTVSDVIDGLKSEQHLAQVSKDGERFYHCHDDKSRRMAAYMTEHFWGVEISAVIHESQNIKFLGLKKGAEFIGKTLFLTYLAYSIAYGPYSVYWQPNMEYQIWYDLAEKFNIAGETVATVGGVSALFASYGPTIYSLLNIVKATILPVSENQQAFADGKLGNLAKVVLWAGAFASAFPYIGINLLASKEEITTTAMSTTSAVTTTSLMTTTMANPTTIPSAQANFYTTEIILQWVAILGNEAIENAEGLRDFIQEKMGNEQIPTINNDPLLQPAVNFLRQKLLGGIKASIQAALRARNEGDTAEAHLEKLCHLFPTVINGKNEALDSFWNKWIKNFSRYNKGLTLVTNLANEYKSAVDWINNHTLSQARDLLSDYENLDKPNYSCRKRKPVEPIMFKLFNNDILVEKDGDEHKINGAEFFHQFLSDAAVEFGNTILREVITAAKHINPQKNTPVIPDLEVDSVFKSRVTTGVTAFRLMGSGVGLAFATWEAISTITNSFITERTSFYGFVLNCGITIAGTFAVGVLLYVVMKRFSALMYDAIALLKNDIFPLIKEKKFSEARKLLANSLCDHAGPYPKTTAALAVVCVLLCSMSFATNEFATFEAVLAFALPPEIAGTLRILAALMPLEVNPYCLVTGLVMPALAQIAKSTKVCAPLSNEFLREQTKLLEHLEEMLHEVNTMSDENIMRIMMLLHDNDVLTMLRHDEKGIEQVPTKVLEKLFEKTERQIKATSQVSVSYLEKLIHDRQNELLGNQYSGNTHNDFDNVVTLDVEEVNETTPLK